MIRSCHNLLIFPCFAPTQASSNETIQATSKQDRVGSSLPGRATHFDVIVVCNLREHPFTPDPLLFASRSAWLEEISFCGP